MPVPKGTPPVQSASQDVKTTKRQLKPTPTKLTISRPKRKFFVIETPSSSVFVQFHDRMEWAVQKIAVGAMFEFAIEGDKVSMTDEDVQMRIPAQRSQLLMLARVMALMHEANTKHESQKAS